jgi:hypothetical protein
MNMPTHQCRHSELVELVLHLHLLRLVDAVGEDRAQRPQRDERQFLVLARFETAATFKGLIQSNNSQ